jgi:hypothetical protein
MGCNPNQGDYHQDAQAMPEEIQRDLLVPTILHQTIDDHSRNVSAAGQNIRLRFPTSVTFEVTWGMPGSLRHSAVLISGDHHGTRSGASGVPRDRTSSMWRSGLFGNGIGFRGHGLDAGAPQRALRSNCVQINDARPLWARAKSLKFLVGVAGFEPATPASRTQCSTGLSHTPTRRRLIALGFAYRKKAN